jgi:hypothetical protein
MPPYPYYRCVCIVSLLLILGGCAAKRQFDAATWKRSGPSTRGAMLESLLELDFKHIKSSIHILRDSPTFSHATTYGQIIRLLGSPDSVNSDGSVIHFDDGKYESELNCFYNVGNLNEIGTNYALGFGFAEDDTLVFIKVSQ